MSALWRTTLQVSAIALICQAKLEPLILRLLLAAIAFGILLACNQSERRRD